jgi:alpha-tubulin suppressor-like RCC1 family protein
MQLLLVDNRVKDVQTVTQSLLPGVDFVLVDFETDTYETLVAKIPVKTYDSVGIFEENYELNTYQLVSSFGNSVLTNVETQDPTLETWSKYKSLLSYFKNTLKAKNLDLMGCNINSSPDWNYVIDYLGKQFQIKINSSNDNTGSPDFGGNWILESGNQDLVGKYFSNNIDTYQFVLGQVSSYTTILQNNGTVFAVGSNISGQFGDGTTTSKPFPVQVLASAEVPLRNVVQVSSGSSHTVFLLSNGSVFAVGYNGNGQLGDGTTSTTNKLFPVQVLASAGTPLSNVVQVSAGSTHTVFLLRNGSVFAVGLNTSGQLGNGTTTNTVAGTYPVQVKTNATTFLTNVVQVACGSIHTVFLLSNGSVFAVGLNTSGQLGNGTITNTVAGTYPVQVKTNATTFLTNVVQVACGASHTVFLLRNGSVFAVGSNSNGQLGNGTTTTTVVGTYPVQVKTNATTFLTNVVQVSAGLYHTVFFKNDGTVLAVGSNTNGQLGDGTTTQTLYPVQVKTNATTFLTNVVQISCGSNHTVFLLRNGSVFAVGLNSSGQLGDGTTTQRLYPVQVLANANNGLIGGYFITEYNSYYYKNKSTITNTNLASLTYSLLDYLMIGLTPTQLNASPYNYTESSFYNQSVVNFLITNGYYTIQQMLDAGITIQQMFAGGVTVQQMLAGGVTIQQMFSNGITPGQMLGGGITIQQMYTGGITIKQMFDGGVSPIQMFLYNIYESTNTLTYDTIVTSTTLATRIDNNGYTIDLTGKNFRYYNLVTNSYTTYNKLRISTNGWLGFSSNISESSNGASNQLPTNTLRFFSFDSVSTIGGYFDSNNNLFISFVGYASNTTTNLPFTIVIKVTPTGLIQVYYQSIGGLGTANSTPIIGWVGNNSSTITRDDIFYSTFNGSNAFVQSNINGKFLNFDFTVPGITIQQMFDAGITIQQMFASGITVQQILAAGIAFQELFAVGVTIQQLFTEGVTVQQLLASFTIQQLSDSFIYESTNTLTYDTAVTSTTLATNVDTGVYNIDLTGKNFRYYNLVTNSYTTYNSLSISTNGWLGFSSSIAESGSGTSNQLPTNTMRFFSFDAKSTIKYYFDSNNNLFISAVGSFWNNATDTPFTIVIKVNPTGLIQVYYQSIGSGSRTPIIGWVGNNSTITTDDIFYSTFNGTNVFVPSNINGKFLNFDFTTQIQYKGCLTPAQMYAGGITIQQMLDIGITIQQMFTGGATPAQMLAAGITIQQMFAAGITPAQMLAAGITIQQMLAVGITIQQMFTGGVTPAQMYAGGITIQQMLDIGITIQQMFTGGVTPAQMLAGGITIQQMFTGGVTPAQMYVGGITIQQMLSNGITLVQMVSGGITIQQMLDAGITIQQMFAGGITIQQMMLYNIYESNNTLAYDTGVTSTTLATGIDDNGYTIDLTGKNFRYYNLVTNSYTTYNSLSISTNGWLEFTSFNGNSSGTNLQTPLNTLRFFSFDARSTIKYYFDSNNNLFISTVGAYYGNDTDTPFTIVIKVTTVGMIQVYYQSIGTGTYYNPIIGWVGNNSTITTDDTFYSTFNGTNTFVQTNINGKFLNFDFTGLYVFMTANAPLLDIYAYTSSYGYTTELITNIASVNVNYKQAPTEPTISSINGISPTSVNPTISISFTQTPADTTITNYSWSIDGTSYTVLSPAQLTSPLTIPASGLTSGTNYTFRIKAINVTGSSSASTGVSAMFINLQPPAEPTITSIVTLNGVTSISFNQNPSDSSITNYAYSTSSIIINNNIVTVQPFSNFTLLSPAQTSSPLTIQGLNGVSKIKIKAFNDLYSNESNSFSNWYDYPGSMICFKEDTQILTSNGYVRIQELKKGDLIQTFKHGLKPITVIAKEEIFHTASTTRMADQLYKASKSEYNELFADLVITGRHSILIDELDGKCLNKKEYDGKYKLQAYKDAKFTVYEPKGKYMIYNFALQDYHDKNYGVYANGLLVECCGEKCLQQQKSMTLV